MFYLITDSNNKTWRDVTWEENITHEQNDNPNYLFSVYDDPILAHMMNSAYEGFKNPNIWLAEGKVTNSFEFRYECSKLTAKKQIQVNIPTDDQRIAFAILCSIQIVSNPIYKKWAKNYLSGNDRTKEKAESVMRELQEIKLGEAKNRQDEYVSCAIVSIMSITTDPWTFSANTAHRAFYDSPEEDRINLIKLSNIAVSLKMEEIAEIL